MYVKYVYFKSNVYDYYMIVQLYIHSNLLICVIVLLTNASLLGHKVKTLLLLNETCSDAEWFYIISVCLDGAIPEI